MKKQASHAIPCLPLLGAKSGAQQCGDGSMAQSWLNCGNCGVMGIDAERRSGGNNGLEVQSADEIHDNRHAATGKE